MAGFRSSRSHLTAQGIAAGMSGSLAAADARLSDRLGVRHSPVHEATLSVLTELMSMGVGLSNGDTPLILRTLMRTLAQAKPMLLENISSMPPDRIKAFMGDLVARMQTIIDTPDRADITEGLPDGEASGDPGRYESA